LRFVVEREREEDRIDPGLLEELERAHGARLQVDLVPRGTLYDRKEPLSFGMAGKPVYIDRAQALVERSS
jgi:phenylacetate-CoA ligase